MVRTDEDRVKAILRLGSQGGDYNDRDNPPLAPFIETASSIVDSLVIFLDENGYSPLSSSKLELIERWLSAHCYVVSDRIYKRKRTERAQAEFAMSSETPYLDMAKM